MRSVTLLPPTEPIADDDAAIAAAVEAGVVGALLPAVAHATGDLSVLRDELRPDPDAVFDPAAGLTPDQEAEARSLAAEALRSWRDRGCPAPPPPTPAELDRLLGFVVGEANVGGYGPLLREELALEGDLRAPTWTKDQIAPDAELSVAVVGAGMSGILAAHRLRQAGVPVTVYEKNDDVGGTWFENRYPGCRVDVANHLYSYSFAQTTWPELFSSQEVLLDYFRRCADVFGVRQAIAFGTEVLGAAWDDVAGAWSLTVRGPDGVERTEVAQVLVSAVGQLNRPSYPDIEGRDDFAGVAFHSARWPEDLDLTGKRVVVIGTGASAMQLIPPVADAAAHTTVLQRTPAWLIPSPDYLDEVPDGMRWLLAHVPGYGQWYRLWLFWRTHEGLLTTAAVDPDWPGGERSVSASNDLVRELLTDYLATELEGHPELLDAVTPRYPPIAKRVIRDNGIWARTLTRDDVDLVTTPIERIEATGVRMADGVLHEADVVIYGTGFAASSFLTPMHLTGRDGVDLHERWGGDARAYLGVAVPEFPNLFLLYGPNTNIVINGSIIYFSELEVRYLLEAIRLLLGGGHRSLEVRPEVHDAFNEAVDEANRAMAWGHSQVNSWYKNDQGRVAQNWPFSLLEYWERTRVVDPEDYELR